MKKIEIAANMSAEIFHAGHINFLRRVKNHFGEDNVYVTLTVLLSTNKQIKEFKKREPLIDYDLREIVVSSCLYVDKVEPHPDKITYDLVDRFDYLFHGDDLLDWDSAHINKGMNLFIEKNKLILLPYTKGISTTIIIERIKNLSKI
ncbi:adenylyltransferase/cytidyltransferase family protein [Olivibacter sp. CPCC 100613]|uniref:adenylyltransferase/cytidyltransferase family protein n=1 Tax=Olivibacter sp. CPCC 100613 TaxID=3079931 RepID=UPI002FF5721E